MLTWKRMKYGCLRHAPGRIGEKYTEKYNRKFTSWRFKEVMSKTKDMLTIDLGANIGEYSLLLAKYSKRVYAFEPDPWALERLRENTRHLDNVEIIEAAAGCEQGKVKLFRHPDFDGDPTVNSQSSSIIATKSNITQETFFEVDQVNLIQFIRDLEGPVGVLKMDIEGAEVDLLEALFEHPNILNKISYIFVETHEKKIVGHETRVAALREKAMRMKRPEINLNWH